jgi:hypothetical protein
MRKPNYRFERAERDRLKQAKKEEKLRRRQRESGALPDDGSDPADTPNPPADPIAADKTGQ